VGGGGVVAGGDQGGGAVDVGGGEAAPGEGLAGEARAGGGVGAPEGAVVGGVVLDPPVGLADQALDVVEEDGELEGDAGGGLEAEQPAPGVEGVVVIGADEGTRAIVQAAVAREGDVERRRPRGGVAVRQPALAAGRQGDELGAAAAL